VKTLADIRAVTATLPPRLLIYGAEGVGKKALGARFLAPVFLQTEDATPSGITAASFSLPDTLDAAMAEKERRGLPPIAPTGGVGGPRKCQRQGTFDNPQFKRLDLKRLSSSPDNIPSRQDYCQFELAVGRRTARLAPLSLPQDAWLLLSP